MSMTTTQHDRLGVSEFVLAALSTAEGRPFQPVHVQKLFFLIDQELSPRLGGKYFHFRPYDYGPFDSQVYMTLERLELDGLVEITQEAEHSARRYSLTEAGQRQGEEYFKSLEPNIARKIRTFSNFVRKSSFAGLVNAIYRRYPEWKANSVFA